MSLPSELKLTDCPLLRDAGALKAADLVAQYNALAGQLAQLAGGKFAYLLNRPDLQGILDDAQRVREQLTRPRYRVGFLGTSQAGKSTTFNNVLQEEIAQGGIGDATTSTITRFRRVDGGTNRFAIRFLTQDQYAERRDKLCKALHILNAGAKPNAEILAFLSDPAKLATLQNGDEANRRRDRTGERSFLPDDVPYLRDFLRAYDIHGPRVVVKTGPPREVAVPFERRAEYLNHFDNETGTPSETLLVADAEVATPNSNIPQKLEAIDCPGLGSKRSVDTVITKEYLPHLDGALIFLRSDQLRSKDVVEILEVLKTNFGKLEGRVWIVVNKFDVLTREPLFGDANGNTVFDLIRQFVQDYQIPAEQEVFTSKRIHELAAKNGGKAPLEQVCMLLGLPANDPIPPRAKADRAQAAAFQHLLDDGGVSHLRRLILNTIADSVSVQISGAAKREMASLAEHLQQKLYEKVVTGEQRKRVIEAMSVDELAKQFQLHGKLLEQELDDQINVDVIDRLYGEVGERLYGLPNVPLLRSAGPHDAWQEFRKQDRDPHGWRRREFPNFRSEELFEGLTGAQVFSGFDGPAYLTLMREKIRVGVHQVMHAIRVQMRRRLKSMERELAMLIYKPEPTN